MYRLKLPDLPDPTLQVSDRASPAPATESTFQTANRTANFLTIIDNMAYEVEYTDEFEQWWKTLDEEMQDSIDVVVKRLEEMGPNLPFPYTSGIKESRHSHLRELRVQHKREPYRILYAFDPRRVAVLLVGGSKKGNDRWYEENVPKADKLYNELLKELKNEGLI
ncbi:MAG TPA: addiction module toxin RelE [Cyanobacteria bacterium UBA11149]|nr:addiction module toxin RelE [Cyanobacteria bacterium UBA11367]HBE60793.1 addiction module toxin RelE [Cyanobacteria bacterium UBA11366]HBK66420.1 addiction module toxin RelE [Cyanobacteria bacterium UBA11166]HBR73647.1 addiction module toxin RelE [Cyanobacteria bacterium UBA11159]HBS72198.1 addiction module toxin RelE [Cyanobacteria bacterium UBA11153]HBW90270.1 addiction module toxin RelE [Cyanobacteria bacterium UBA11149]HCA98198.1 addiction module toxin RelE [Cyanobacteria bacterium UBA